MAPPSTPTRIGLVGLAVMGQNLALNIAEKGFPISVYNRTTSKVDETVERAKLEDSQQDYDSSVLLNDHFDSPLGSPGTSDVLHQYWNC
ncbi:6-phosphogluconate dehydrogenase, decarboxylating 1-like isoform X2 [Cannabis sativa]|uniref:6-phosphogluconate dehydrogenase, decarboxylating 1-like isoform X2 n=1 Tax=Cannabis sativa TaxID=3483 RepID=UPI0029CA047B|nr:6-phosphogluconate dehydrogenase, decarboxylating 1-like isoform X2 [Cannabis sativa]